MNNTKITNYADDNTPYICDKNIDIALNILESDGNTIFNWFAENFLKANANKSHLIVTKKPEGFSVTIGNDTIRCSAEEKLLGIYIDYELKFENHVTHLCKKSNQKLLALSRIAPFINTEKLKVLMRAFVNSQFGYCPLLWMFHSRRLNNCINRIQEKALRITYKDNTSTFQELLTRDNSVTIHQRNLQVLATEIFKWKNNLSPKIMSDIFNFKEAKYNLRKFNDMAVGNIKTTTYGTETIRYRAPLTWEMVPEHIKQSQSISEFKTKIKS